MKRLILFAAAAMIAVSSSAAVRYGLNGGVTNNYGWENPQDMYETLNADWNAHSGNSTVWKPLTEVSGINIASGIPSQAGAMNLSFLENEGFKTHFAWLIEYMDEKCAEQGKTLPSSNPSYLRYNLAAFFGNSQRVTWPVSADYTTCGVSNYEAYKDTWKAAFANPTEPTVACELNDPYREGKFFAGWFASADFSGEKITTIDANFSGVLYAKWYDFPIVSISEALALTDSTVCSVQGTITLVSGNNLWMQDSKAAINVYQKDHGLKAGDKVIFKDAIKTVRYGIPQISYADSIVIEGNNTIIPNTITVATLLENMDAYLNHYVHIEALKATWEGDELYFKENDTKVLVYNSGITATELSEGHKLDAYVVVSAYNGTIQFRTNIDLVTKTGIPGKDNYAYPARGANNDYTLKNDWLYANTLDNFRSNRPNNQASYVRGMAVKDSIMYFVDREFHRLVRVDGKTGTMLEPISLANNLWTKTITLQNGTDSIVSAALALKDNDIKKDNAGNLLVGACSMNSNDFQIWKIDETTGTGELVIHDSIWGAVEYDQMKWRVDAFGVYGDVNNNAVIMACNAEAMNVFKWTIENGKQVGGAEIIKLKVDDIYSSLTQGGAVISSPGIAPQIYIVNESFFFIDGMATYPTMFDMRGYLVEDVKNISTGLEIMNNDGDISVLDKGQNGLVEFQVGDDYFLLIAAASVRTGNTFALYKYADEARFFADMEPLWYFPASGFGTAANTSCAAIPSVEVNNKTGIVHFYLYAAENGYGRYTFQGKPLVDTPTTDVTLNVIKQAAKTYKVLENGTLYIIRGDNKYTIDGRNVE